MKTRWWMASASVIGILMVVLGVGSLVDPDNTGSLFGQLALLAVMATGAALIATGLMLLRQNAPSGGKLIALGVLPGSVGIAFFWFPPAVAVGILAIATSWAAFRSGDEVVRQAVRA